MRSRRTPRVSSPWRSRDIELDGVEIRTGSFSATVDGKRDRVRRRLRAGCTGNGRRGASATVASTCRSSRGDGAPELDQLLAGIQRRHSSLEVEVHDGGQPYYPLLVVAE